MKSATASWGYEVGPWKGPGPPLLVAADLFLSEPIAEHVAGP